MYIYTKRQAGGQTGVGLKNRAGADGRQGAVGYSNRLEGSSLSLVRSGGLECVDTGVAQRQVVAGKGCRVQEQVGWNRSGHVRTGLGPLSPGNHVHGA